MQNLEVLITLLYLHNIDFGEFKTNELKVWLHSLRNISRELEKEIIYRDRIQQGQTPASPYHRGRN